MHPLPAGKPQIWGTQYKKDAGGRWTMDPIDETARTDEQRRAHRVPTLAEAKQRMEAMNRKP